MKLGFAFIPDGSVTEVVNVIRTGERLGYDTAWMPDQTFFRDPFVVLAASALGTERMELGLGVTNPFTRHPVQVARAAATLADLAPRRLKLGYGAGNPKHLLHPMGLEHVRTAERIREALVLIRRLLRGDTVDYTSETFTLTGLRLLSEPSPDLPLYVAGRSPAILRVAGEYADGVILSGFSTPAAIDQAREVLAPGLRARSPDLGPISQVLWTSCFLVDDTASWRTARLAVAEVIERAPPRGLLMAGIDGARVDELKSTAADGGLDQLSEELTLPELSAFAIIGDAAQCRAQLEDIRRAGIDEVVVLLRSGPVSGKAAVIEQLMRALAPDA